MSLSMAAMPWYLDNWYKQLDKFLNASEIHVYIGDIVVDEDGSREAKLSRLAEHEALSTLSPRGLDQRNAAYCT